MKKIRMIYQDPITEKKPEGMAELIKQVGGDSEQELWEVRFKGEKETYIRTIKARQEVMPLLCRG